MNSRIQEVLYEPKKLGDFLIEAGLIDDMQLQAALAHQRNWNGRLGSILIEMGVHRRGRPHQGPSRRSSVFRR